MGFVPPVASTQLCPRTFNNTHILIDNAAMIAWAGILKLRRQGGVGDAYGRLLKPKWSMEAIEADEKIEEEGEEVPPAEVTVVRV
ncbi:hypothetical protein QFC24_001125 [Naganishia onofrii]|uniref:Uncharacterized protein n=1 Tax=Naganishia onofrii TaxID=1851511 RepID=A0ACC2XVP9_9TREE|nr:hypothetical protein QFC24_001125 [Naganishia onofrii]